MGLLMQSGGTLMGRRPAMIMSHQTKRLWKNLNLKNSSWTLRWRRRQRNQTKKDFEDKISQDPTQSPPLMKKNDCVCQFFRYKSDYPKMLPVILLNFCELIYFNNVFIHVGQRMQLWRKVSLSS